MDIVESFNNQPNSGYEFIKMMGDASKKEFFKIRHAGTKNRDRLVVKITKENGNYDEKFDTLDVHFHSQYDYFKHTFNLLSNSIGNVPKIIAWDDQNGVILMENVGKQRCKELVLDLVSKGLDTTELYKKMIDWLIKLRDLSNSVPKEDIVKKRIFGKQSVKDEICTFKYYMKLNENDSVQFDNCIDTILNELYGKDELTLCHRDYQVRNIMYHMNEIYVIDTQDMCLGPALYDLACLLYDSNVVLSDDVREYLARYYYLNTLSTEESATTFESSDAQFEEFMNKLRLLGLLRVMKSHGVHSKYFIETGRKVSYSAIQNNNKILYELIADRTDRTDRTDCLSQPSLLLLRNIIYKYRVVPVILAAGKGSRMKSALPKTICEIRGKPMLFYILDQVVKLNPYKIVLVVGYKKDEIVEKLREYPLELNIEFVEQVQTLGTGHAVLQAKGALANASLDKNPMTCSTLVLYGDKPCISYDTLSKLITKHYSQNYDSTLLTYNDEPSFKRCGRIIRSQSGNILQMYEDEDINYSSNEFNGGIQIFNNRTLFKLLPRIENKNKQNEYYLTDIVKLINDDNGKAGKVGNLLISKDRSGELMNVNTPEDLQKALMFII